MGLLRTYFSLMNFDEPWLILVLLDCSHRDLCSVTTCIYDFFEQACMISDHV